MANLTIQNNSTSGLAIWDPVFEDDTLTSAGAATWLKGTLLGRITIGGKLTAYESGNADGSEIPVAVLFEEVVFTGAGDAPDRVVVSGRLRRNDLVAFNVGAITIAEVDALRDYSIVALLTTQLAELDNQ